MLCTEGATVEAREELREGLRKLNCLLPRAFGRAHAETQMRNLIFNWHTVVPMSRFVHKVARSWRFFGRRLPTRVSEAAPDTDEEVSNWEEEMETEDESVDGEEEMVIDI
jgi:hypothetical protein